MLRRRRAFLAYPISTRACHTRTPSRIQARAVPVPFVPSPWVSATGRRLLSGGARTSRFVIVPSIAKASSSAASRPRARRQTCYFRRAAGTTRASPMSGKQGQPKKRVNRKAILHTRHGLTCRKKICPSATGPRIQNREYECPRSVLWWFRSPCLNPAR